MADPRVKQLKIKTGVVKRILKEKFMYEKENEQEKARLDRMEAQGKDEYEIKKQGEVLRESQMMVPECQKRLLTAVTDLEKVLNDEKELVELEEFQLAQNAVDEARPHIPPM